MRQIKFTYAQHVSKHLILLALIVLFCLFLASCGVESNTESEDQVARAEHFINQKRYSEAVQILENIPERELLAKEKLSLLGYAYLGTLNLSLSNIYSFINSLKNYADEKEGKEFSRKALQATMAKLPDFDQKSTTTLNKVIVILEKSPEFQTRNKNLKHLYIGSLYAYHFIIRLKRLYKILMAIEETGKEPEESVSTIMIDLVKDVDQIEKNFSNSYEKVQGLISSFEDKFQLVLSSEL